VIGADHLILEGGRRVASDDLTLAAAVERHVRLVLDRAGGDEEEAAELLGISVEELREQLGTP
jgi:hypothetical protein